MTASKGAAGERRVVLHLGMLKTGSTSIQTVWDGYRDERIEYASLGMPNHSLVLQRAFLEGKAADRVFRTSTPDERAQQHRDALQKVGRALGQGSRSVIFSGESLFRLDRNACQRCVDFLRARVSQIDALLYVRAPESFARSVFQERLKQGPASFDLGSMIPAYRQRMMCWSETLGVEPTYVLFDRSTLHEGDVVADFGMRLGLDPAWAKARAHLQDRNASLSAEATAALYLLRHQRGAPAPADVERQHRLVEVLQGFGHRRLDFGREVIGPVLEEWAEEIAWIEGRLGRPFPKETVKDPVLFSSEREILDYGEAQAGPLGEYLRERGIGGGRAGSSTVDLLESVLSLAKGSSNSHRGNERRKRHLALKTILGGLGRQFARVRR